MEQINPTTSTNGHQEENLDISKRSYAEFNRARIARMQGTIAVHEQTVNLDKVLNYASNQAAREKDQFNPETPEAMEAQIFLDWLNNGKNF
jgi:hypothetical protein